MILNETNEPEQQQNGFYGPKTSSAGNSSLSHPFFLKKLIDFTEQVSGNRSHIKLYYSRTGLRNSLSLLLLELVCGLSIFIGRSLLFSLLSQIWV